MNDRREAILTRVLQICAGLTGISADYRNVDDITELLRPAVVLKDGNEVASDANDARSKKGVVNLVDIYPEIWLLDGGNMASMPASLADLRMQLINGAMITRWMIRYPLLPQDFV